MVSGLVPVFCRLVNCPLCQETSAVQEISSTSFVKIQYPVLLQVEFEINLSCALGVKEGEWLLGRDSRWSLDASTIFREQRCDSGEG